MKAKLAILGGEKTIKHDISPYNSISEREIDAANEVLKRKVYSGFLASWDDKFYGGIEVQQFERAWEKYFHVKHAISVNSATSGLMAALGAIDLEPGDEVIVSPWTMCATATAILVWNAIPVFADIETETFNLDPLSIKNNITSATKAIVVPDIFGHAAQLNEIMAIAKEHNLYVIEDAAQSPGAKYHDHFVGTVADIGVYSLNVHKHIQTGEGGVCVTNNSILAERIHLIRNHGEVVVEGKETANISNIIGFNFRLTEIQAAMAKIQLERIEELINPIITNGNKLTEGVSGLEGLKPPSVAYKCTHVYYVYGMILDNNFPVPRKKLIEALKAEGIPGLGGGYQNIHLLPMYQKKIAYGHHGFPWNSRVNDIQYNKGICPIAETLHDKNYFGLSLCLKDFKEHDIELMIQGFQKVWAQLDML